MKNPGAWLTTLAPLVVLVWMLAGALNPQRPWDAVRIAGFALGVVFLTLVFLARLQLGDSFSIAPQARKLVTTGIYSKLRHPVYVFGTLAILGIALYLHLWTLLLVVLLIIPVQVVRARAEERVLLEKFGEEYLRYKSRTWF
jgi:protein-S-isoprenylcysteine O-methyltransferase Ste14